VLKKNPTTVKSVFMNYPLRSHKFAFKAAQAALAARRQGKFWEFHDALFKDYRKINDEKIQQIAVQLELDQSQYEKDRQDPATKKKIQQDVQQALSMGITSVPAVFVNGKRLKRWNLDGFQKAIDKELKKVKNK
jgi:protein-disulfide isomerase